MTGTKYDQVLWNYHQTARQEEFVSSRPRMRHLARIIRRLGMSGRLLDIGIGDGYLLTLMASSGMAIFGIDLSPENVALTEKKFREKNIPLDLKVGNINNLPFEDETFDTITASEVLEHLQESDLDIGIQEVLRCLKKGGFLIATVPAEEDLKKEMWLCPSCGSLFHRWGHRQSYTEERLRALLQAFDSIIIRRRIFPSETLSVTSNIWRRFGNIMRVILKTLSLLKSDETFVVVAKK